MLTSRVLSRNSRGIYVHCQISSLLSLSQNQYLSILSNSAHSLCESPNKVVTSMDYSLLDPSTPNLSASPKSSKKKSIQTVNGSNIGKHGASTNIEPAKTKGDTKVSADQKEGLDVEKLGACTNAKPAKTNGDAKVAADQKEGLGIEKHGPCTNAEPAKTNGDAKVPNAKVFADQKEGLGFGVTRASKPMTTLLEDMEKMVAENEEFLKLRLSCKKTEKMQDRILHSIANLEKRQEKIIRRHADLQKTQEKILRVQEKFLRGQEEMKETHKLILHNCSEKIPAKLFLDSLSARVNVQTKLLHGHEEMERTLAKIISQHEIYPMIFDVFDDKLNKILAFKEEMATTQAKAEGLPKCYRPSDAELKVQEEKMEKMVKRIEDAKVKVTKKPKEDAKVNVALSVGAIVGLTSLYFQYFH